MTEFDQKLFMHLHNYRRESKKKIYEIADEAGIHRKRMYAFTSGNRTLNGEDTKKLMDYLNLTVELKEKD